MSNPAVISLTGQYTNLGGSSAQMNVNIPVGAPVGAVTAVSLASGLNTIAIPDTATLVVVQLPLGNAVSVTLKGVTGDTGIPIVPSGGVIMFQPATGTSRTFVLTTGGAIAAITIATYL